MSCETDLQSINSNTQNTNINISTLSNKVEELKAKQDKTNELLTKLIIAINGGV